MSIFNSVLGSLSPPPKFRRSFEDPHVRDYELPRYNLPPSPRIPPPITSSVLWNAPKSSLPPPPRVPDGILALQRRAQHLEQQLQELLDAQADGLMGSLSGQEDTTDDITSNGSTTPTVSSVRSSDRNTENGIDGHRRRKNVSLNAARLGISRRIRQLASLRAEELEMLDEDLQELQVTVQKTEAWSQKRTKLESKIEGIEKADAGAKTESLQTEASKLEQEIRQKEEELWVLKRRHRRVLDELADKEISVEARLSSYKASLSLLDREVSSFLVRPPTMKHTPLSSTPFLSLPAKRRTLEMAHEYWQDEYTRLAEKCEELDIDRSALDEGAVMWNDVIKKVAEYEENLQSFMQQVGRSNAPDPSRLLEQMDTTIMFLEDKLEFATLGAWNLLVCAVGAELEAFVQGKAVLEEALGVKRKGKEKARNNLVDIGNSGTDREEEMTGSAIRIVRSPPKPSLPKPKPQPKLFDTDDEDPDPELMISHQDTDTD